MNFKELFHIARLSSACVKGYRTHKRSRTLRCVGGTLAVSPLRGAQVPFCFVMAKDILFILHQWSNLSISSTVGGNKDWRSSEGRHSNQPCHRKATPLSVNTLMSLTENVKLRLSWAFLSRQTLLSHLTYEFYRSSLCVYFQRASSFKFTPMRRICLWRLLVQISTLHFVSFFLLMSLLYGIAFPFCSYFFFIYIYISNLFYFSFLSSTLVYQKEVIKG